jgi:hypothetical protein
MHPGTSDAHQMRSPSPSGRGLLLCARDDLAFFSFSADCRRSARSGVVLALVMALAASVLAAGAPQSASAAQLGSCTGGSLQPNSLSVQQ